MRCIRSSSTMPSGAPNEHESAMRGAKFLIPQESSSWAESASAAPELTKRCRSSRRGFRSGCFWAGIAMAAPDYPRRALPPTKLGAAAAKIGSAPRGREGTHARAGPDAGDETLDRLAEHRVHEGRRDVAQRHEGEGALV